MFSKVFVILCIILIITGIILSFNSYAVAGMVMSVAGNVGIIVNTLVT
jgi:hypothetical protein